MTDTAEPTDQLNVVLFSSLPPERVRWLWPGRIPLGKVTLISGGEGLGKSLLTFDIAARVSRGGDWSDAPPLPLDQTAADQPETARSDGARDWPLDRDALAKVRNPVNMVDGKSPPLPAPTGSVLLLNAYDHLADTVGPCLAAAGADRRRVAAINGMLSRERGHAGPLGDVDLLANLPQIRQQLKQMPDVRLLVIDPLSAYCGGIGPYPNATSHKIAAVLNELAAEHCIAVVVITDERHTGLPTRTAWTVQPDPFSSDLRLWSPAKFHYGPQPQGLSYRIHNGRIQWQPDSPRLTIEQVLRSGQLKRGIQRIQVVSEWLRQQLCHGPRDASDIYVTGDMLGLSPQMIWRAKSTLHVAVTKTRDEQRSKWIWELPPTATS